MVTWIEGPPGAGVRPISSPTARMVWRTFSVMRPELLAACCSWLPTVSGPRLGMEGLFLGLADCVRAYSRDTVC